MTEQDLDKILKTIKTLPEGSDETARTLLKAAADSITLERIRALTAGTSQEQTKAQESLSSPEILMPTRFKKQFRYKGVMAHVHKRKSGKRNWNYEVRCMIEGVKFNASSNDFGKSKQKFIDKLDEYDKYGVLQTPSVPTTLDGFADYFFENFYRRKVKAETLRIGLFSTKTTSRHTSATCRLKKLRPSSVRSF